jgi:hypothetical protein
MPRSCAIAAWKRCQDSARSCDGRPIGAYAVSCSSLISGAYFLFVGYLLVNEAVRRPPVAVPAAHA